MAQTLQIHAQTARQVVVLAVNRPEGDLRRARGEDARHALIAELLGRGDARLSHVDLIAIADLDDIGLAGFLRDGPGVPEAALAPHRARLGALTGFVLILYPGVFETDGEIALGADLTLIAALDTEPTSWDAAHTLTSAAARDLAPQARKKPSDAAMSGRVAMVALLVIALLTALMIWIA